MEKLERLLNAMRDARERGVIPESDLTVTEKFVAEAKANAASPAHAR